MVATLKNLGVSRRVFVIFRYVKENEDLVEIIKDFFAKASKRSRAPRSLWQVDILDPMLPAGSDLLQGLVRAIKGCDLAVVIGSEVSNNVAFELGLIYALGKDFILLVPEGSVVDFQRSFSDISGIKYSVYDPKRLMRIPEILERELKVLNERRAAKAVEKLTPEYLLALGDELRLLGLREEAVDKYKAALAIQPENIHCLVRLGQTYLEMYHLEESEIALRQALAIDDRYALAYELLAQVLLDSGQYEKAIEDCLEKLLVLDPKNEAHYFKLTTALNEMWRADLAVHHLSAAIDRGLTSPGLYYDRAWSCIRYSRFCSGEEKEAWIQQGLQSLAEAVRRSPDFVDRARRDQDFDAVRHRSDFPVPLR